MNCPGCVETLTLFPKSYSSFQKVVGICSSRNANYSSIDLVADFIFQKEFHWSVSSKHSVK